MIIFEGIPWKVSLTLIHVKKKKKTRYATPFTLYTEEELGIDDKSDAGNTPLCPFDCSYCFWGYIQKSVGCSCFLWSSESDFHVVL